jgi:proline-specific peptidase
LESTFSDEGFIPFRGYKVWYGISGDEEEKGKLPLLCLHGGPGASHDYLTPLSALTNTGRRVIFYDQLGSGRSDHPDNPDLWTVELYVEEVGVVREALGLDRIHLLGQSWGGQLAMEYTLTKPPGLESLILADSLADMSQWISEANRLRAQLPLEIQEVMQKHESNGTTDDPAYEEAGMEFYRRHMCRLEVWPDIVVKTFENLAEYPQVYNTMWGPNEFNVTGTLKDWNIVDRLREIDIPTLVLSGRHDESTPAINETIHKGIKGSEWVIFENSAHMPHIEEPERYLSVLNDFLERIESR